MRQQDIENNLTFSHLIHGSFWISLDRRWYWSLIDWDKQHACVEWVRIYDSDSDLWFDLSFFRFSYSWCNAAAACCMHAAWFIWMINCLSFVFILFGCFLVLPSSIATSNRNVCNLIVRGGIHQNYRHQDWPLLQLPQRAQMHHPASREDSLN